MARAARLARGLWCDQVNKRRCMLLCNSTCATLICPGSLTSGGGHSRTPSPVAARRESFDRRHCGLETPWRVDDLTTHLEHTRSINCCAAQHRLCTLSPPLSFLPSPAHLRGAKQSRGDARVCVRRQRVQGVSRRNHFSRWPLPPRVSQCPVCDKIHHPFPISPHRAQGFKARGILAGHGVSRQARMHVCASVYRHYLSTSTPRHKGAPNLAQGQGKAHRGRKVGGLRHRPTQATHPTSRKQGQRRPRSRLHRHTR